MSSVKLISITPDAENIITYCARVSAPQNQEDYTKSSKLLHYCIKNQHWSIFEMANICFEINTTRAISAQILRHRSFSFQEFSQRYSDTGILGKTVMPHLRRQDNKNRQNSIDDIPLYKKLKMQGDIQEHFARGQNLYKRLVDDGVALECARFVLPLATPTRMYMKGSCRSWIHYIALRTHEATQKEHRDVAEAAKCIFICQFPDVAAALDWKRTPECPECDYQSAITLE